MAEITLNQAEAILSRYRHLGTYRGMTDYEIARTVDIISTNTFCSALVFGGLNLLQYAINSDSIRSLNLATFIVMIAVSIFFYFRGRPYAKIRELFEFQAPQYLHQLDPSFKVPVATTDSPDDW